MRRLSANRCYLLLIATACLLAVAGCAGPLGHRAANSLAGTHLNSDLMDRTGYDLGPQKNIGVACLPEPFNEQSLSEEDAINMALWNNPGYQELLADLKISQADLLQAAQIRNPQVITFFPWGPKQWELTLYLPIEILWARPPRVAAAQLETKRVGQRLVQDGLNAVRDTRLAYADWQLADQRLELVARGTELRKEIARIGEEKLKAGEMAELDVAPVRLDAIFAEQELRQAHRDFEIAQERMRYLLGIALTDISIIPGPVSAVPEDEFDVEALVQQSVLCRPDIRAAELAAYAAEQRAKLAHRDYLNLSGVLPDLNSRGQNGFEAGPGLQLNLPIFNLNQGAIARAEADAERLRRQRQNLQATAATEIRQAYLRLQQARDNYVTWRDQAVPQAEESIRNARQALEEDAVTQLLVLETTRQWLDANNRKLQAAADVRRAVAELERSVGKRLFELN